MTEQGEDVGSSRRVEKLAALASKSFGRFAVSVQHHSEAVQLAVIAQLPEFRKLATKALDTLEADFQKFADLEHENEKHLHDSFHSQQDALNRMLDDPELSLDDKLRIIHEIADLQTRWDRFIRDGKSHKLKVMTQRTIQVVGVAALVVVAVVGGKAAIDQTVDGGN